MAESVYVGSIVTEDGLTELLDFFSKNAYRAKAKSTDRRYEIIHKMCLHMVARDYGIEVIDNKAGQLCGHYPSELIVLVGHLNRRQDGAAPRVRVKVNSASQLKELFTTARFARCRSRFVMPVLLYKNKNICRSATLSTMAELYGRSGMDLLVTGGEGTPEAEGSMTLGIAGNSSVNNDSELLNRIRGQDVQLLKALGVTLICDLMVENKKMKYGIRVSSSEKVDKWARYADFRIASLPYPGCEFFKEYKDNGRNPVSLYFNWDQPGVDAVMALPEAMEDLVPFRRYKEWDLVEITQNYIKLLLYDLKHSESGLLIHCISGWDRTPLIITLLRLTLWADGEAHQSLSPSEILYFTLAYDWLLYGHQFKERHDKGEEILYFCFDFLKYITSTEYSISGAADSPSPLDCSDGRRDGGELGSLDSTCCYVEIPSRRHRESCDIEGSWVQVEGPRLQPRATTASDIATTSNILPLSNSGTTFDTPNGEEEEEEGVTSLPGSWTHLSLDHPHYNSEPCSHGDVSSRSPSCPESERSLGSHSTTRSCPSEGEAGVSLRAKRLMTVRELFVRAYRSSVSDTQDQAVGNITRTFSGLLSRIANSL